MKMRVDAMESVSSGMSRRKAKGQRAPRHLILPARKLRLQFHRARLQENLLMLSRRAIAVTKSVWLIKPEGRGTDARSE
jgi:hypothetical protein